MANQPAIIGGPKKALKTSFALDLGISVASGEDFLGHFVVPERKRVLIISGESGPATLQETARRIQAAKCVSSSDDLPLWWRCDMPPLADEATMRSLVATIECYGIEIVIIDPTYLALVAPGRSLQPTNIYEMGALFSRISYGCIAAGATPIFVHHTRKLKKKSEKYEPIELDDLAFAGIQEFARQWILLNRREPYQQGSGEHRLWMTVGGSAGFSGCYEIDVVEGILQPDFSGRTWGVDVRVADQSASIQRLAGRESQERHEAKVLEALETFPDGETASRIAAAAKLPNDKAKAALNPLVASKRVESITIEKRCGRGTRPEQGFRLASPAPEPALQPPSRKTVHVEPAKGVKVAARSRTMDRTDKRLLKGRKSVRTKKPRSAATPIKAHRKTDRKSPSKELKQPSSNQLMRLLAKHDPAPIR